jgi:hypothetical protein
MVTRLVAVALLLSVASGPAVRFVQPVRSLVLAGPSGTTFLLQAWVERHPDNRWVDISWVGDNCGGSAGQSLDGEYAEKIIPRAPLKVHATYGVCELTISVYGAGRKLRARASMPMQICGGGEENPCGR